MSWTLDVSPFGAVNYSEAPGSPRISFTGNVMRVQRTLICDYSRWQQLVVGLLGFPIVKDISTTVDVGQYISRRLPHTFPVTDGLDGDDPDRKRWVAATSIDSIEGSGELLGVSAAIRETVQYYQYQYAKVVVNYETITYQLREDYEIWPNYEVIADGQTFPYPSEERLERYVTRVTLPSAEYLTLPYGSYYWQRKQGEATPAIRFLGANGRILPSQEIHWIWHQVPNIPAATKTHIGTVNAETMYDAVLDKYYRRGTLLLTSTDIKPYRWPTGQKLYDITYKMKYFEPIEVDDDDETPVSGHNYFLWYRSPQDAFLNGVGPEYRRLVSDSNGGNPDTDNRIRSVYEYKNFTKLFRL